MWAFSAIDSLVLADQSMWYFERRAAPLDLLDESISWICDHRVLQTVNISEYKKS